MVRDGVDTVESTEPIDREDSVVVAEVDVTVTMSVIEDRNEPTAEEEKEEEDKEEEEGPPVFLKDMDDLRRNLELMHDRCIARNLRAAGLGTFEAIDECTVYGKLTTKARMIDTGESMLWAVINRVHDVDKQVFSVLTLSPPLYDARAVILVSLPRHFDRRKS